MIILDTDFTLFGTPNSKGFRELKLLAVETNWFGGDLQNWWKRRAGFRDRHKSLG